MLAAMYNLTIMMDKIPDPLLVFNTDNATLNKEIGKITIVSALDYNFVFLWVVFIAASYIIPDELYLNLHILLLDWFFHVIYYILSGLGISWVYFVGLMYKMDLPIYPDGFYLSANLTITQKVNLYHVMYKMFSFTDAVALISCLILVPLYGKFLVQYEETVLTSYILRTMCYGEACLVTFNACIWTWVFTSYPKFYEMVNETIAKHDNYQNFSLTNYWITAFEMNLAYLVVMAMQYWLLFFPDKKVVIRMSTVRQILAIPKRRCPPSGLKKLLGSIVYRLSKK